MLEKHAEKLCSILEQVQSNNAKVKQYVDRMRLYLKRIKEKDSDSKKKVEVKEDDDINAAVFDNCKSTRHRSFLINELITIRHCEVVANEDLDGLPKEIKEAFDRYYDVNFRFWFKDVISGFRIASEKYEYKKSLVDRAQLKLDGKIVEMHRLILECQFYIDEFSGCLDKLTALLSNEAPPQAMEVYCWQRLKEAKGSSHQFITDNTAQLKGHNLTFYKNTSFKAAYLNVTSNGLKARKEYDVTYCSIPLTPLKVRMYSNLQLFSLVKPKLRSTATTTNDETVVEREVFDPRAEIVEFLAIDDFYDIMVAYIMKRKKLEDIVSRENWHTILQPMHDIYQRVVTESVMATILLRRDLEFGKLLDHEQAIKQYDATTVSLLTALTTMRDSLVEQYRTFLANEDYKTLPEALQTEFKECTSKELKELQAGPSSRSSASDDTSTTATKASTVTTVSSYIYRAGRTGW